MCCGAMLSKKKSVLRLRKSKKNNATVSLVFTARFTPQSAWDIFVIKLGRHTYPDKAVWHAVWQARERGYAGWPDVPPPSLASLARPADGCFGLNALWNLWSRVLLGLLSVKNWFVWMIWPEHAWERCEVTASWLNIQQWELTHSDAWLSMLMLQKELKPWRYYCISSHGHRTIHKPQSAWGTERNILRRESARQLGICDCTIWMWSDQSRHYCWTHSFTYFISRRSTADSNAICLPQASIGIAQHDKFYAVAIWPATALPASCSEITKWTAASSSPMRNLHFLTSHDFDNLKAVGVREQKDSVSNFCPFFLDPVSFVMALWFRFSSRCPVFWGENHCFSFNWRH